jgi:ferrous iron transport protein A
MSQPMKSPVTARSLDQWPSQTWAEVVSLMPAGDEEDRVVLLRLLEIGFLPGEPVRVIARGLPGGDPMAVRVGHTTFALRRHEAAMIRVQATAGVAGAAA